MDIVSVILLLVKGTEIGLNDKMGSVKLFNLKNIYLLIFNKHYFFRCIIEFKSYEIRNTFGTRDEQIFFIILKNINLLTVV